MKTDNNIQEALDIITQYGGIDGAHHKQWVLDQIVRTLTKTEKGYEKWLKEYKKRRFQPRPNLIQSKFSFSPLN